MIDILRGIIGIVSMLVICYLFSQNKSKINWKTVGVGLAMQGVLAVLILKVPGVSTIFDYIAKAFERILSFSQAGAEFLFGGLVVDTNTFGYIFAFQVLPTIVFFSALSSILYYLSLIHI